MPTSALESLAFAHGFRGLIPASACKQRIASCQNVFTRARLNAALFRNRSELPGAVDQEVAPVAITLTGIWLDQIANDDLRIRAARQVTETMRSHGQKELVYARSVDDECYQV